MVEPNEASSHHHLRELYPESHPYHTGFLAVSDLHKICYYQFGNKDGKPVIFLHGGPGSEIGARDHRYFDPEAYHIVLFDQRGCGKSIPQAELTDNTTWHSVEDIEVLRKHLGIEKWVVFGGSWGSALALAYAETHPDRVKAIILRGIFTLRRRELEWFYENGLGTSLIFPDYFEDYRDHIPEVERHDMMHAYYRRLTSDDEKVRSEAAKHWTRWEMATSRLFIDDSFLKRAENESFSLQFARIECHYFVNHGFFDSDTQLIDNAHKIRHIPATIIHGRYDAICPLETAWLLYKNMPDAEFHIVPDAGHSALEDGITSRLVEAADKYKTL